MCTPLYSSSRIIPRYYLEYVCKAARTYGMAPFYWDNGGDGTGAETSGLFNHSTGDFLNKDTEYVVEVMNKAIYTDDENYTLGLVYANAPQ